MEKNTNDIPDFLTIAVHDLRNLLAPMHNIVQLMRARTRGGGESEIADLERLLLRMAQLVDNLADADALARNALAMTIGDAELGEMLDQALRHSQPAITERRQKLTIERPTQAVRLSADARRLVGVFAALLDNASRYTGEGGSIFLSTHVSDTAVEIRVRDSGIGIPEEALPRIFDIFAGRARVHHGFGVSLAIARRVIEAHDGTLRASSAGPGRGSEFIVRLPRNAARSAAALSVQPARSAAVMSAARVLIVDDNAAFRSSLSALVHDWGHEVALAASGPEAMERAAQFQPQWVLLDANLPGDNGYQVARQLRRLSAGESMHVVLMSGNAPNDVSRRAAKDAGCDECIDKLHFDAFERLLRPSLPA